jgi:iron-sulfur cluster assembly protein
MITASEKAALHIEELRKESSLGPDYFIRVAVEGGGCSGLSYKLDFDNEERQGDQAFESNGVKIVVDMKSFLYLCGTELDFSDGLNGKGFNFINPNATRTCGCGESFAV